MKYFNKISTKFSQTVFGFVIALFVLTQAVIVTEENKENPEQEQSDKTENQQVGEAIAIPASSLQLNLDYQSYLVEEVFFQNENEENAPIVKSILPSAQKALKILFRRIISPNAP
ncbi:hypothetical protein [Ekhidna sp.]